MIILLQMHIDSDRWDDMLIPPDKSKMPEQGEYPLVDSIDSLCMQLTTAGLVGIYRVVLQTGELWQITVEKEHIYTAKRKKIEPNTEG